MGLVAVRPELDGTQISNAAVEAEFIDVIFHTTSAGFPSGLVQVAELSCVGLTGLGSLIVSPSDTIPTTDSSLHGE